MLDNLEESASVYECFRDNLAWMILVKKSSCDSFDVTEDPLDGVFYKGYHHEYHQQSIL